MKLHRYTNRNSPFLHVDATATEVEELLSRLSNFGPKGSRSRSGIVFSGYRAIEVLQVLQQPLNEYAEWAAAHPRPTRYLPDSVFLEEAKKYAFKQEWRNKSHWSYQQVFKKRRHLWAECTAHMQTPLGPILRGYQIYAYEFPDRSVYVGLTCNPVQRHQNHLFTGSVFDYCKLTGHAPLFITVHDGLTATAAAVTEEQTVQCYRDFGWAILNRKQTGALGTVMMAPKYTYEALLEMARPFACKTRFLEAHQGPYQFVCKHGWLPRLVTDLGWKEHVGHVWNYDLCLESARRFEYHADWAAAEAGAYLWAHRAGVLKQIKQDAFPDGPRPHVSKNPFTTREACEARARDFKSRSSWQYNCHDGSFAVAKKNGWRDEICLAVFGPDRFTVGVERRAVKAQQFIKCECGCGQDTPAFDKKQRKRRFATQSCRVRGSMGNRIRSKFKACGTLWRVTAPDGHVSEMENLNAFCLEHGLNNGQMSRVASGHRQQHKGYSVVKIRLSDSVAPVTTE